MSSSDADEATTARRLRRTWPQRLTIATAAVAALGCFATGSVLFAAQRVVEDRNLVVIERPDDDEVAVPDSSFESSADDDTPTITTASVGEPSSNTAAIAPVETFPLAEPAAKNFLITGADNNACVDPDSRYAPAFGDIGSSRSDTIMMWRVNPATSQVAVLSFPRDLYVDIAGRSGKRKINEAYERDQPQRLIDTIRQEFGIDTDHFIQLDFCAFKTIVDAIGGVGVPFERPVRDPNTGLIVTTPGCFSFDGDHALAYVRSRKMQVQLDDGTWSSDTGDDRARISRQQDFIRRMADRLLSTNSLTPSVVRALVETSDDFVVYDVGLTINKMLEFAGVLNNVDPDEITTYQIEASSQKVLGLDVLVPRIRGENMRAILAVFRGEATLASAPEQVLEDADDTGGATAEPTGFARPAGATPPAPTTTVEPRPFTPIPEVEADDIVYGLVPDPNVTCP